MGAEFREGNNCYVNRIRNGGSTIVGGNSGENVNTTAKVAHADTIGLRGGDTKRGAVRKEFHLANQPTLLGGEGLGLETRGAKQNRVVRRTGQNNSRDRVGGIKR